jgi:acyl carrier protein
MEQGIASAQSDAALRQRVLDSINAVLPHILRGETPAITESTRLMEDLDLSSTSTLELMLEMEEDMEVQIDVEDIEQKDLASIGALADFIAGHALTAG